MISLPANLQLGSIVGRLVEILLPLMLLAALIALCVQLLVPFLGLLLWTIILAVCFYPVHGGPTERGSSNLPSGATIGTSPGRLILVPRAIAFKRPPSSNLSRPFSLHKG